MSDSVGAQGVGGTGGSAERPIDWEAAERSPEFRELVAERRKFVVPCTVFFLVWYLGFILLAASAEDFMGRELFFDGMTVGYGLALTQFIMVWFLGWLYLRRAERVFDPLARKAADKASRSHAGGSAGTSPEVSS